MKYIRDIYYHGCKVKLCITEVRNGFVNNKHKTTQISNIPLSVIMLVTIPTLIEMT